LDLLGLEKYDNEIVSIPGLRGAERNLIKNLSKIIHARVVK
jgi:hypothetical protein